MPRVCSKCRQSKPLEEFSRRGPGSPAPRYACRECERQRARLGRAVLKQSKPVREGITTKTVAIGDVHFPFHNKSAIGWALEVIAKEQPNHVVQVGDVFDQFSFSKWHRSHNAILPKDEIEEARKHALFMWSEIKRLSPKSDCYQLMGNHDQRALKRITESVPSAETFVRDGIRELLTFPGVTLIDDSQDELHIDGVQYEHGHLRFGEHARNNQCNTVCGHSHRGGTMFYSVVPGSYWELNCGFLGDLKSEAFRYMQTKRATNTTLGIGIVDELGPRFCPYI